jgi:hypothetical protein
MSSRSEEYGEFGTISGMEEWPSPEIPFAKRDFKREKPEMIEDEYDELSNRCTKKKMSDRNRVLTINLSSKNPQQKSYMLRSRSKLIDEEDGSSNDDIQSVLWVMEKGGNGANGPKSKADSK